MVKQKNWKRLLNLFECFEPHADIAQFRISARVVQGKRVGDKFYRANGDVLQADYNAALNVLARLDDSEIAYLAKR